MAVRQRSIRQNASQRDAPTAATSQQGLAVSGVGERQGDDRPGEKG